MSCESKGGGTDCSGGDILNAESLKRNEDETNGCGTQTMHSISTWHSLSLVTISTCLCRRGY